MGKDQLPRVLVELGLQQAVDGGRLGAAGFAEPLGRPARGGAQGGLQSQVVEEGEHPPQAGGLAGARPAGEQHHLPPGRHAHCLPLLGGVLDALGGLDAVDDAREPLRRQQLPLAELGEAEGHIGLRLLHLGQIAGVLTRHGLPHDLSPLRQGVQGLGEGQTVLQPQKLAGGPRQLAGGEEGVPVHQVVPELEEEPGFPPLGVLSRRAQVQGQLIRCGKGYAQLLVHQQVGVVLQHVQGLVSVPAVEGHAQLEGEAVLPQKGQQQAHAHLEPEGVPDLEGPLPGDALDAGEVLRVLLQHGEGIRAELLHQPPCGGGAHPLHRAGGQVFQDGLFPHGDPALHDLSLELLSIGGVAAPASLDGEPLAGGGAGHAAHHRHRFALPHGEAQHGVAVFFIAENHRVHRALQDRQFLVLLQGGKLLFIPNTPSGRP